jgi:hypothetical protein
LLSRTTLSTGTFEDYVFIGHEAMLLRNALDGNIALKTNSGESKIKNYRTAWRHNP